MGKTYHEHGVRPNTHVHEAYKAGFISTDTFLSRLKANNNEPAQGDTVAKNNNTRARNKAIKGAMANETHGMRRAYAAARQPPQRFLIITMWNDKPCAIPGAG